MAKADNKTKATKVSVKAFIDGVENDTRRKDAKTLLKIFKKVTGLKPVMWGPSLIGYGRYHYKYDSGREGEMMMTGFSPRKANLVLYTIPGYEELDEHLARLGKHKLGKSCLYVNKLEDIDLSVLEEIIEYGVAHVRATYKTEDK